MNWLGNLGIRNKLILMAAVPVLLLLWFSGNDAWLKFRQAQDMATLGQLSGLSVKLGGLAHEMQKERGMTAAFLGSQGSKFASELPGQRALTDIRVEELNAFLAPFDASGIDAALAERLSQGRAELDRLAAMRQSVDRLAISQPEAVAYYSRTIGGLLGLVDRIASLSNDSGLARQAVTYAALLKAKEHAGIERAMLAGAFAADRFAPGAFARFIGNSASHETWLGQFRAYARPAQTALFEEGMRDPAVRRAAEMKQAAIEHAGEMALGQSPDDWFSAMTTKIDRLKAVEDKLAGDMLETAEAGGRAARLAMFFDVALALAGLALALTMIVLITRQVTGSIAQALQAANALAAGDLTVRIDSHSQDETGQLLIAMRSMVDTLSRIISDVRVASDMLSSASEEVSATAQSLSQGASEQAASVEETSASIEQMTASVGMNTENARTTENIAGLAAAEANEGGDAVKQTVSAMKSIAGKIGIIDDIAYQTNLLALNAAIEAARAGEHGKGFAVVAAEVRKLAERAQVAAQEIGELASGSVDTANLAGRRLVEMLPNIQRTADLVREIAAASEEQGISVGQVNGAMNQLNQATQQNASASEELAATAEEMSGQAEQLQQLMSFFRLEEGATVRAARPRQAADPAVVYTAREDSRIDVDVGVLTKAIEAHTQWKTRLRQCLHDHSQCADPAVVEKDNACALGQWIYGDGAKLGQDAMFQQLRHEHADFHRCAAGVIRAIKGRDRARAQRILDTDYAEVSRKVLTRLTQLKGRAH